MSVECEPEYVCSWCYVEVTKDYNHVNCNQFCSGTFTHPGSGSCRRRFQELTHAQVKVKDRGSP